MRRQHAGDHNDWTSVKVKLIMLYTNARVTQLHTDALESTIVSLFVPSFSARLTSYRVFTLTCMSWEGLVMRAAWIRYDPPLM
jgi:hypothetical protein